MEERWKIESSPIYRAMWEHDVGFDAFCSTAPGFSGRVREVISRSVAAVRRHRQAGTLYGPDGAIAPRLIAALAEAGYWGLRASPAYGGAGGNLQAVTELMTEIAVVDPWVAGLLSCQACIGPVCSLEAFGTAEQKARLLPALASGQRLGAFAVTEPCTSSDWGALRTVARRDGDRLLVSGEKLFITNAAPGRTVSVLCRIDGRHELVVIELPAQEDEHFRTVGYDIAAPAHIRNAGLHFADFPVPAANVLQAPHGDGRAIAHHALGNGRAALCAMTAGLLRAMAGSLIPWVRERQTFGAAIGTRELVQRRLGWLAARIVACDAMAAWTAQLIDDGCRGELEGVTAKVFATESLKEAAVDALLKTLGGRSLLRGSLFVDGLPDLLAPTVYEGENEILTLGCFQSLARAHGARYLAPIAAAMKGGERSEGAPAGASGLWAAGRHAAAYAAWLVGEEAHHAMGRLRHRLTAKPDDLSAVALDVLGATALEISAALRHFGPAVAQRQALAFDLARRAQWATVMLVASRYAERQHDPLVRQAALCAALDLGARLTGSRPTGEAYQMLAELGRAVAYDRFEPVAQAERTPVAMGESLEPLAQAA